MTIFQALNGYYDRQTKLDDPSVPPFGYSWENISFEVVLSQSGEIRDIADRRVSNGKVYRPILMLVPQPPKRSGKNPPPCFLWDKTGYVFGVEPGAKTETGFEIASNPSYHQAFKNYLAESISSSDDTGLLAILAFLDRWEPASYASLLYAEDMLGTNVVFRLDGERGYVHDRPEAQKIWLRINSSADVDHGTCLVIGKSSPLARLHPSIKGVRGAQSAGASITSFNLDAFTSYGKSQGYNAPVSERAAFGYTAALNHLLRRDSPNRLQIGDATTVFWAEAKTPDAAVAAEGLFAALATPPDDSAETKKLHATLKLFEEGRPLESLDLGVDCSTKFYVLGLSPNAARLSVRIWHDTTLGKLGDAFQQHWRDMRFEQPRPRELPPSVWHCALMTAPARKNAQGQIKFSSDDVSPLLTGELMRAILAGNRYPGALLSSLIMRIRADGVVHSTRLALIKAVIVRAMRIEGRLPHEEYLMRSDPDDPNPARRLGRLFAVIERAQQAALGDKVNATVRDKFIGSAAATPGNVFPGLIKNAQPHIARLRRGHSDARWIKNPRGASIAFERDIGQLWSSFPEGPPSQLNIEEQGLFFVGYYQERFGGRPDKDVGPEPGVDTEIEVSEDEE